MKFLSTFRHTIFPSHALFEASTSSPTISFSLFNCFIQKRWKKPTLSAQTRLEDRVIDSKLDKLMTHLNKLNLILKIHHLMSNRKRGPFVSLQLMSRWRSILGLMSTWDHLFTSIHIFLRFFHTPLGGTYVADLPAK